MNNIEKLVHDSTDADSKEIQTRCLKIRSSPGRLKKFEDCVESKGLKCSKSLCLDVLTRWNSTYLMLSMAEKYERAFDAFEIAELYFKVESESDNQGGVSGFIDWYLIRRMTQMLHQFYIATLHSFGSIYITSNTYWTEISDSYVKLSNWKISDDNELKDMAIKMQSKFDKYWGDYDKMNKIIFMASALDSHEKFEYMEDALRTVYSDERGKHLFDGVKIAMLEEYKKKLEPEANSSFDPQKTSVPTNTNMEERGILKQRIKRRRVESGTIRDRKTELKLYLNEAIYDDNKWGFDLLKWWKLNSERFPILSYMARDILAVPISIVASKLTFSTGGRVLDPFRSSLTPKIVEALICTQNCLQHSHEHVKVEEDLDIIEKLEDEMEKFNQKESQGIQSSANVEASSNTESINLDLDH